MLVLTVKFNDLCAEGFFSISGQSYVFSALDEDSNLATSPMPDMDSDSMLGGPVDEEERWLDALEKGELDDNGELKKEVDESLLTARQVKKMKRQKKKNLSYLNSNYPWGFVFRKHCYTSSRASHYWSSPWVTRRKK